MVDKVGRDLGVLRVEIRHFARASLSLSVGTSANAKALRFFSRRSNEEGLADLQRNQQRIGRLTARVYALFDQ